MSHVVTSYQWAWRYASGENVDELLNWAGEMSKKGWELKSMTSSATPTTQATKGGMMNVWSHTVFIFMQRPISLVNTTDGAGWEYPE